MTVANTNAVFYRRFNGYPSPALPEGWWWGRVRVTGDATGGTANMSLALAPIADALNSRMFSLEHMAVYSTEAADRGVRIQGTNLVGPGDLTLGHVIGGVLRASGNANALAGRDYAMLPVFLGSAALQSQQAAISAVLGNVDTIVYDFEAEGYWWGPRSILASGGPQRPVGSVYGG